ncbi:MAG: bifunctional hydroxymethylpyrimidine kinase/phosphomethylpyrimidine kinase, partial [Saccharolobus sp.]
YGPVDPYASSEALIQRETGIEAIEKVLGYLESNLNVTLALLTDTFKANIAYVTDYGDVLSLAGGFIKYLNKIKIDAPILANLNNQVSTLIKKTNGKIGILLPFTEKILNAGEKGVIKLNESGINGDALVSSDMVLIIANNAEELIRKLNEVARS